MPGRTGGSSRQPLHEGHLTFPGRSACQQSCHADIFLQVLPMNSASPGNQPPVLALFGRSVQESGIPGEGNGEGSAIVQLDRQRVRRNRHVFSKGDFHLNRGSTHSKPPSSPRGVLRRDSKFGRFLRGKIPSLFAIGWDRARILRSYPPAKRVHGEARRGRRQKRKSGTAPPATPLVSIHYNLVRCRVATEKGMFRHGFCSSLGKNPSRARQQADPRFISRGRLSAS